MIELYDWQEEIIKSASGEDGCLLAISTCNESGKTAVLIPRIAVAHAKKYPGSQTIVFSPSRRELEHQNCPSMEFYFSSSCVGSNRGMWTYCLESERGLPPSEIIMIYNQDLLEGFHDRTYLDKDRNECFAPVLSLVDCAPSCTEEILQCIGRTTPSRTILFASGSKPYTAFADRFNDDGWNKFCVDWTMCPHLQIGNTFKIKSDFEKQKGRQDPLVRRVLYGEIA